MSLSCCFVSCANKKYYRFVVPFLYSCLRVCSEKNVTAEIFIEDLAEFESVYQEAIGFLREAFGSQFCFTQVGF